MGINISSASGGGNASIVLYPFSYDSITQGTWTFGANANCRTGGRSINTTNADADALQFKRELSIGTYTVVLLYDTDANAGILEIDVGGTNWLTQDLYENPGTYNNRASATSKTIGAKAVYDIDVKINGKNVLSTDHYALIQAIVISKVA